MPSLSRLARSTKDAITISERLEKGGADLVSLSERIDTTTAQTTVSAADGERIVQERMLAVGVMVHVQV